MRKRERKGERNEEEWEEVEKTKMNRGQRSGRRHMHTALTQTHIHTN